MVRVQYISILVSLLFLANVARLILKGKLREEYAVIWIISTLLLIVFSFWRNGLTVFAKLFGIYEPLNLVFAGAILAILIYLLHLSISVSKLQQQNKVLTQEIALLKEKQERKEKN